MYTTVYACPSHDPRVTLQILNSEKSKLKTLENRNALLELDVQRFNERKELEREV